MSIVFFNILGTDQKRGCKISPAPLLWWVNNFLYSANQFHAVLLLLGYYFHTFTFEDDFLTSLFEFSVYYPHNINTQLKPSSKRLCPRSPGFVQMASFELCNRFARFIGTIAREWVPSTARHCRIMRPDDCQMPTLELRTRVKPSADYWRTRAHPALWKRTCSCPRTCAVLKYVHVRRTCPAEEYICACWEFAREPPASRLQVEIIIQPLGVLLKSFAGCSFTRGAPAQFFDERRGENHRRAKGPHTRSS